MHYHPDVICFSPASEKCSFSLFSDNLISGLRTPIKKDEGYVLKTRLGSFVLFLSRQYEVMNISWDKWGQDKAPSQHKK